MGYKEREKLDKPIGTGILLRVLIKIVVVVFLGFKDTTCHHKVEEEIESSGSTDNIEWKLLLLQAVHTVEKETPA